MGDEPALNARNAPAVSPRPHWITIATSALSPVAVIAAIVFGYLGYRASQNSLEISQRAYLTVSAMEVSFPKDSTSEDAKTPLMVRFDITNLGNTPAQFEAITARMSPMMKGERKEVDDTVSAGLMIGPSMTVNRLAVFSVDRRGKMSWAIRARITYSDVFKTTHSFDSCATVHQTEPVTTTHVRFSDCPGLHFSDKP